MNGNSGPSDALPCSKDTALTWVCVGNNNEQPANRDGTVPLGYQTTEGSERERRAAVCAAAAQSRQTGPYDDDATSGSEADLIRWNDGDALLRRLKKHFANLGFV